MFREWICGKQLDRSRARTMGQVRKVTPGQKILMPSNGQNWENKNLALRVTFPSLAYHQSCGLDPLEITSRLQLYFSSRPRKAAKLGK